MGCSLCGAADPNVSTAVTYVAVMLLRDPSAAALPVRLNKRDRLYLEDLVGVPDENRAEILARQHGIGRGSHDGNTQRSLAHPIIVPMKLQFPGG